jgi:hypothetical protein
VKRANYLIPVNKIRRIFNCIIVIIFLFSIIFSITPSASASGQDATFESIKINITPPKQGIGGEIQIECIAEFYGGCCYHLYAYDVKGVLNAPENITVISPEPRVIPEIDATPGGMSTNAKFKWTIVGTKAGIYDLKIEVSTSNCGTITETITVIIVEGVSFSNAITHPKTPSVNEAITFLVDIRSGNDLVDIESTTLYIWRSNQDHPASKLSAESDTIFEIIIPAQTSDEESGIKNDTSDDNKTITQDEQAEDVTKMIGSGKAYNMEKIQYTNKWRLRLDEFEDEEILYYWYNTKTTDGKNITSYINRQPIEDLEKKYAMVDTTIQTTVVSITLGIILILGLSWTFYGRADKKKIKSGIFFLGSASYSQPTKGIRTNISGFSLRKTRSLLLLILFIIAILLIILSIYYGLLDTLISEVRGS